MLIVVDIVNEDFFNNICLYALKRFTKNCTFLLLINEEKIKNPGLVNFIQDSLKNVKVLDRQRWDILNVSNIIKEPWYLVMTENDILTKPLVESELFETDSGSGVSSGRKTKAYTTTESFPHGTLEWTTTRDEWFSCYYHLKMNIDRDIYDQRCMTISPQIIFTNIAKEICLPGSLQLYWFYLVKHGKTGLYSEKPVLYNKELRFNVRHDIPLEYGCSIVKNGCLNDAFFISVCENKNPEPLLECYYKTISKPSITSLKTLMDEFTVYKTDFPKIRLGDPRDGGYVINDLPTSFLYTFGVGNTYNFEKEFVKTKNVECYMFDHTVDASPEDRRIKFFKTGVGVYKNIDKNIDTLENIVKVPGCTLKMDIEGYEWLSLLHVPDFTLNLVNQLIIEFHWLDSDMNASIEDKIKTLRRLNEKFTLTHVHGVNCRQTIEVKGCEGGEKDDTFHIHPVLECTYIRTSIGKNKEVYKGPLPTKLDMPNDSCLHDVNLSKLYPYNK